MSHGWEKILKLDIKMYFRYTEEFLRVRFIEFSAFVHEITDNIKQEMKYDVYIMGMMKCWDKILRKIFQRVNMEYCLINAKNKKIMYVFLFIHVEYIKFIVFTVAILLCFFIMFFFIFFCALYNIFLIFLFVNLYIFL